MSSDRRLIESLGGPAKVADLLGYDKYGGVQRVHNWMSRGIPAKVRLQYPEFFLRPQGAIITDDTGGRRVANRRRGDGEEPRIGDGLRGNCAGDIT